MIKEFSLRGWKVAGGSRNENLLETLKGTLNADNFIQPFDITEPNEVENFALKVKESLGVPDLLINNAGIINKNSPLTKISPDEFLDVLAVNLGGIHNMIRAFVPKMETVGSGIIANFSSYWGQSSAPDFGPYCASKWGVEGLTRSLSQELPSGLATIAFNPGIIDTDMLRSCFGKQASSHETPDAWAKHAVDRLEAITLADNGKTIIG